MSFMSLYQAIIDTLHSTMGLTERILMHPRVDRMYLSTLHGWQNLYFVQKSIHILICIRTPPNIWSPTNMPWSELCSVSLMMRLLINVNTPLADRTVAGATCVTYIHNS